MDKPRITMAQFRAMQNGKPTVGALIERYIREMNGLNGQPAVRVIGESQMYAMRAMLRRPIAAKVAEDLTKHDIIEDARARRLEVCPATVMHDVSNLTVVLKYAGAAWPDCDDLTDAAVVAAKPFLTKHVYIGKSTPRKRRPTDEEITSLLTYFETPATRGKARSIRMADVIAFALVSTRRLGEICRITYGDIDWEKRTYWVRDLKHPTKKKGNDKEFAMFPEIEEIFRRQPRLRPDDPTERLFPYNPKSCSAAYTLAKKRIGIQGLRFHDNRREAVSRWLTKLPPHKVRQISGHETTVILERVYDAPKPEDLLKEVELDSTESFFWSRVNKTDDCWLWTGAKTSAGYGAIAVNGRAKLAHRYSYELANGPIAQGLLCCHKCDTPLCVRPDHIFLGTDKDNHDDMVAKGRAWKYGNKSKAEVETRLND